MKWGLWSQTAASNSATPPDGWPEGQAPSTVNDCAREMMAQIAVGLQDLQFIDLGLVPTQTSGNTFTVPGNVPSLHYGRRLKVSDGANTLYGTITSASYGVTTAVTVRFDNGNAPLDSSLSAFAVGNPSQLNNALPDMAFKPLNIIDNPQFDVAQRGLGPWSLSSGASLYTADRWLINCILSAGGTVAARLSQRSANASNVPTLAQCGILMNLSMNISSNAAISTLGSTDVVNLVQRVEGYQWRRLAQKPTTLSFWVNSDVTGTYCVSLAATTGNPSCVLEYSVSAVSTWEKKTLTFPKSIAAGTWDYSSGIGVAVRFAIVAGSANQGGAGNWTATAIGATVNQVNFMSAANKSIKFAGITLNEGNQALPLTDVDVGLEFAKAGRFLQVLSAGTLISHFAVDNQRIFAMKQLAPQMRAAPSLSTVGTINTTSNFVVTTAGGVAQTVSSIVANSSNPMVVTIDARVVGTPLTVGTGGQFQIAGSGAVILKAEL